jgi:hypothetical protein
MHDQGPATDPTPPSHRCVEVLTSTHPMRCREHGRPLDAAGSGGEFGAALAPARREDGATRTGAHTQPEAMSLGPAPVVRLEGPLAHQKTPQSCCQGTSRNSREYRCSGLSGERHCSRPLRAGSNSRSQASTRYGRADRGVKPSASCRGPRRVGRRRAATARPAFRRSVQVHRLPITGHPSAYPQPVVFALHTVVRASGHGAEANRLWSCVLLSGTARHAGQGSGGDRRPDQPLRRRAAPPDRHRRPGLCAQDVDNRVDAERAVAQWNPEV